MTEDQSNRLESPPRKFTVISKEKKNGNPVSRFRVNHSQPRKLESLRHNNSLEKKRYQNDRVNFAIFNAEENIHSYLKDMKNSFIADA